MKNKGSFHNITCMRVRLSEKSLLQLFESLDQQGLDRGQMGEIAQVSGRTISAWRRGEYTIPVDSLNRLVLSAEVSIAPGEMTQLETWWNNQQAGRKGARVRMNKHGALGTQGSRQKGGRASFLKRRGDPSDIFATRPIRRPDETAQFAEFVGIMIGDGNMTNYQASVTLNSLVDQQYSIFVAGLLEQLFGTKPSISKRPEANCVNVVVSSKNLVSFLKQKGVKVGHKIRQGLDIPGWILANESLSAACVRGIFDTDGCIFQECHRIKGKKYGYPRWSLVSASGNLRTSIRDILIDLGYNPKIRNGRSVNLENASDIAKYFREVGTSNPKHLERYKQFGGVG